MATAQQLYEGGVGKCTTPAVYLIDELSVFRSPLMPRLHGSASIVIDVDICMYYVSGLVRYSSSLHCTFQYFIQLLERIIRKVGYVAGPGPSHAIAEHQLYALTNELCI